MIEMYSIAQKASASSRRLLEDSSQISGREVASILAAVAILAFMLRLCMMRLQAQLSWQRDEALENRQQMRDQWQPFHREGWAGADPDRNNAPLVWRRALELQRAMGRAARARAHSAPLTDAVGDSQSTPPPPTTLQRIRTHLWRQLTLQHSSTLSSSVSTKEGPTQLPEGVDPLASGSDTTLLISPFVAPPGPAEADPPSPPSPSGAAPCAATAPELGRSDTTGRACIICFDAAADHVLIPCGHGGFCGDCARRFLARNMTCPTCRADVQQVVKVHTSTQVGGLSSTCLPE